MKADYLIVGSGLTGAVIARCLADRGRDVLVLERRNHVGGNVHDTTHPSGIRVHTYGPHYFRTRSPAIWEFVNRFARFYPFAARVQTFVDGQHERWPVSAAYVRRVAGPGWRPAFQGQPANFEEAALAALPRSVYEKCVRGYTEKQWGVPARSLAADLARRFSVREGDDDRLSQVAYQGLPEGGYAAWTSALLAGIPTILNCDYLKDREEFLHRRALIFTGPVDEFFGFDLGRLAYRSQRREHEYVPAAAQVQPCVQVNNPDPDAGPHVRSLEWKHLLEPHEAASVVGSVLTRETPYSADNPNHYEYPFPDDRNARLHQAYACRIPSVPGLVVCGRLGRYRYLDMDQAIGAALAVARKLLSQEPGNV